jgi:tRNA G18 (ribose-2'-O)-methylase SpoU
VLNNYKFNSEKNICLVFGNEIEGVSKEILDMADVCIEIPQLGIKHSLNVSVAGGIVIWDVLSKKLKNF